MTLLNHLQGNYIIAKLAEDGIVLRNSSGNAADGKSIYTKSQGIYNQVRKYRRHLKRNQEKLDGYLSERLDQFDSVSMLNQSSGSAAEEPALVRSTSSLNPHIFLMGKGLTEMFREERFHSNV